MATARAVCSAPRRINAFAQNDLKNELNDVAFKSQLGEFQLNSFEPSDIASLEDFFLESVKLIADSKEVKHMVIIPFETEYGYDPQCYDRGSSYRRCK